MEYVKSCVGLASLDVLAICREKQKQQNQERKEKEKKRTQKGERKR